MSEKIKGIMSELQAMATFENFWKPENVNLEDEFKKLSEPLIEFIKTQCNPHCKILIDCDSAEMLDGVCVIKQQFKMSSGISDRNGIMAEDGDKVKCRFIYSSNKTPYKQDFEVKDDRYVYGIVKFENGAFIIDWEEEDSRINFEFYKKNLHQYIYHQNVQEERRSLGDLGEFKHIYKLEPFEIITEQNK